MTHKATLYRSTYDGVSTTDWEVEVDITYTIHPGSRGVRVDGARFAEPDEPDEVDILDVRDEDGHVYELTDKEEARIVAEILEKD